MRLLFIFTILFVTYNVSFGQKIAAINLKDSCIMSGGIIKLADFKKLCKICPPNVKKVVSFNVSYPLNPPVYGKLFCKGNRYNTSIVVPSTRAGNVIVIENIKAIGMDGKPVDVPDMTLGISPK